MTSLLYLFAFVSRLNLTDTIESLTMKFTTIAALIFALVVGTSQALFSVEDIMEFHRKFLSSEQLEHLERKLRGYGGGGGSGRGWGGNGGGGGSTGSWQDTIHYLNQNRDRIDRGDPKEIRNGFEIITTSASEKVGEAIQKHVDDMKDRCVRRIDPLFEMLCAHRDDIMMDIKNINDRGRVGVKVEHTGETEIARCVINEHRKIVDDFLEDGVDPPNFHRKVDCPPT